jgi:hypothetical protein
MMKVGGNETSNIEGGLGGECRWSIGAMRQQEADEVSEVARSPSGRIGEHPCDAAKGITNWGGRRRVFEPLMIGRNRFLWRSKPSFNCDHCFTSHFRIFLRLQKLTAYFMPPFLIDGYLVHISAHSDACIWKISTTEFFHKDFPIY